MVFRLIGASSLRNCKTAFRSETLFSRIDAEGGLSFNPRSKCKLAQEWLQGELTGASGLVIWHDAVNNTINSHEKNDFQPCPIVKFIQTLVLRRSRITAIVYIQRNDTDNVLTALKETGIDIESKVDLTDKEFESDLRKVHPKVTTELKVLQAVTDHIKEVLTSNITVAQQVKKKKNNRPNQRQRQRFQKRNAGSPLIRALWSPQCLERRISVGASLLRASGLISVGASLLNASGSWSLLAREESPSNSDLRTNMPNIMSHNHNTRLTSTKYPCGACAGECKDGSVACILCNYRQVTAQDYHQASWWPCQKPLDWCGCANLAKRRVWNGCWKTRSKLTLRRRKRLLQRSWKTNSMRLKTPTRSWLKINCHFSNKTLKLNLKTYFQKTEKAHRAGPKLPNGMLPWWMVWEPSWKRRLRTKDWNKQIKKMGKNVILHRVPESDKSEASARAGDDIKFFKQLTEDILGFGDLKPTKAISVGAKKTSKDSDGTTAERVSSRPLKIVLPSKEDRDLVFRNLRKLRAADESFASISVSCDLSQDLRKQIKLKIEEAKNKDGENAKNYMYRMRWPPNRLEVQKLKRKVKLSAESLDAAFVDNPWSFFFSILMRWQTKRRKSVQG